MKIARLRPRETADGHNNNTKNKEIIAKYAKKETYGLVDTDSGMAATRDDITFAMGIPIPRGVSDFLFGGWYDKVVSTGDIPYDSPLDAYDLLAPLPDPGKIACLAFNYTDHATEQKMAASTNPVLVLKPKTALTGTGSYIHCPGFVSKLDYEIELGLVIGNSSDGRPCKNISEQDAYKYIFGYMICNDVSARDVQFSDMQFTRAKGMDTFAPCGPWITTADEIADAQNMRLTTRVNGTVRQNSTTAMMSLKIPQIVSRISESMTLEPGDVISTGTPAGVALNNPDVSYLEDGDIIEMEIKGLGSIRNIVKMA